MSQVSAGFFNPSFLSAGLSEFTLIPLVNILALGFAAASVINYVQAVGMGGKGVRVSGHDEWELDGQAKGSAAIHM
jgi:hypothetical protein